MKIYSEKKEKQKRKGEDYESINASRNSFILLV